MVLKEAISNLIYYFDNRNIFFNKEKLPVAASLGQLFSCHSFAIPFVYRWQF